MFLWLPLLDKQTCQNI